MFPRFLTIFFVLALMCMGGGINSHAATTKHRKHNEDAGRYASIIVDAHTGAVLSATSPDKQLHPASLTKMMTLLLTFDSLANGHLRQSDYIRISSHAAGMSPSKLGIRAGGKIRVEDAIRAVSVKSANDIAAALAEAIGGTESRFAQLMNDRAREIGMTRTRFINASGLHHRFQVSTARDMAVLARYILKTYPQHYKYFGLRQFSYAGRAHPNHNRLMNSYAGMDGFKTGYISQSGFNLVASAQRGDRRLIGVVFGGRTARTRNDQMAKLLNSAFAGTGVRPAPDRLSDPIMTAQTSSPAAMALDDPIGDQIAHLSQRPPMPIQTELATISPASGGGDIPLPARPARRAIPSGKGILALPTSEENSHRKTSPLVLARLPDDKPSSLNQKEWAVQIGSYQSRDTTDRALYSAMKKLPRDLRHASPVVAPYKSLDDGWMFRARLTNLDARQARRACSQFRGCLILPPGAH